MTVVDNKSVVWQQPNATDVSVRVLEFFASSVVWDKSHKTLPKAAVDYVRPCVARKRVNWVPRDTPPHRRA